MPATITRHTDKFSTAPQLGPEDMAEVAALGFHTVINNHPDGEGGPTQPSSETIARAAEAAGLTYIHLPVISGQITERQARQFAELLALKPGTRVVALDSAKQAHYLPAILGVQAWFGTTEQCIEAACTGRWA